MTHHTRTPHAFRKRIVRALVCVAVLILVAFGYMAWSETRLRTTYKTFADAEYRFEAAAFKPGMEENPIRREVSLLLAQVIQGDMTPLDRLEKSRSGIAHLNDIESEIDDIKEIGDDVRPLRIAFEAQARSLSNMRNRTASIDLVTLAARQAEIIADIRGLSYRTNFYTDEVFERVIDDQGVMTDAHKQYLNDLIPQLEEQFDRRSNLYRELADNAETMKRLSNGLGYDTE